MKLIDLHFEWVKTGELPHGNGLCEELENTKYNEYLNLFTPNQDDKMGEFWACDDADFIFYYQNHLTSYNGDLWKRYSLTRQLIVLLICAMNDEI